MRFPVSVFFLFFIKVFSQTEYPKDYFMSPLDIPLELSGSFGELRNNHFHSGLDCKTEQRTGLKVYAAASGYISRIKISSWGYGKVIYITHPNGFTTAYAHLLKGSPQIEALIKKKQYEKKNYEIELFFFPKEFLVTKGDVIAFSGNSGGSGGPHLHFEIRETKGDRPINPLLFGFDQWIPDTKSPVVSEVMVYPLSDSTVINTLTKPLALKVFLQKDGSYRTAAIVVKGKIGFGINAYDTWNTSSNKNGIYKVQTFFNWNSYFCYAFDSFSFDETRYINALIDYPLFITTATRYQKLFMKQAYPLSIIDKGQNNGWLTVDSRTEIDYKIEVSDYNGNKTVVHIPISYDPDAYIFEDTAKLAFFVNSKIDNHYKKERVSVFVPARVFYEDTYLNFEVKDEILTFGNKKIPLHSPVTISFELDKMPEEVRNKTFIASLEGNKMSYNATSFNKKTNTLSIKTTTLGSYKLAQDTIAPKIKMVNFKEGKWLSKQKTLELEISDNLSGIKEYHVYFNEKWVLMEYDYKTRKLIHDFDDGVVVEGRNTLKVVVSDNMGNSRTLQTHFFRTQKQH